MAGSVIKTDSYSERLRARAVRPLERKLLIANIANSPQAKDLTKPTNCNGFGRIRHFRRQSDASWPRNPLPTDPACRALGLANVDELQAQVFQNAACNWRCWYCYVPFSLLEAKQNGSSQWMSSEELIDLYVCEDEATRPQMIDLTGGQPELVPEWVLWTMEAMRARCLEGKVFLWSDDNLSNDYFWRFLTESERDYIATFSGYGRVACFKGFDSASFTFNTSAEPALFDRQFDLFKRLLQSGIDLYAYATFTTPHRERIHDGMAKFVDRLQEIHPNLPLRTIPLQIGRFGVVKERLNGPLRRLEPQATVAESNQRIAIEAWLQQLQSRFPSDIRDKCIVDVPMRRGRC